MKRLLEIRTIAALAKTIALALFTLLACTSMFCNDGAASIALGGIQLRKEARISMQKERLQISWKLVSVEYEFLNESAQDVTTEVAFPIPPYANQYGEAKGGINEDYSYSLNGYSENFRVWIDGKAVQYKVETRATLKGVDCSELLRKYKLDIATLGHYRYKRAAPLDYLRLSPSARRKVVALGLVQDSGEIRTPMWTVHKTYHWTHTFPAGKMVNVRHEYRPIPGNGQVMNEDLNESASRVLKGPRPLNGPRSGELSPDAKRKVTTREDWLDDFCIDHKLADQVMVRNKVRVKATCDPDFMKCFPLPSVQYVDYVLTTANTWKTPIKDFELIVESDSLTSFCWDGSVEHVTPTHYRVRATDFIPREDLHVAFFEP